MIIQSGVNVGNTWRLAATVVYRSSLQRLLLLIQRKQTYAYMRANPYSISTLSPLIKTNPARINWGIYRHTHLTIMDSFRRKASINYWKDLWKIGIPKLNLISRCLLCSTWLFNEKTWGWTSRLSPRNRNNYWLRKHAVGPLVWPSERRPIID